MENKVGKIILVILILSFISYLVGPSFVEPKKEKVSIKDTVVVTKEYDELVIIIR